MQPNSTEPIPALSDPRAPALTTTEPLVVADGTPHTATPSAAWKAFFAGGVGGMSLILAGHPFDLLKVRLQTAGSHASTNLNTTTASRPTSALQLCRHILVHEGPRGLYRGVMPPVLGATPINALAFWSYDFGLRCMRWWDQHSQKWFPTASVSPAATRPAWTTPIDKDVLTLSQIAGAGAISAIFPVLLIGPAERLKILLQVQPMATPGAVAKTAAPHLSLWQLAHRVYRQEGLRGVFRGTMATFVRDIPGCAIYFTTYEAVRRYVSQHTTLSWMIPTPLTVMLAGGIAGIVDWTFTMPIDTLKSRLQTAAPGQYPRGIRDVAVHLARTEGLCVLYRGVGPAMLRAFPANAACFAGYEATMSLLHLVD
ncbi:carnitine transporter [Dimargaris verticillata]|uniref:Carnitine transporter n=1 Tax=Dimargaris verticillata TaxID=2761393 RepID=A0A9W8BB45_9FUNG|nr:carnitine transporter [Dimargaris verticillata]